MATGTTEGRGRARGKWARRVAWLAGIWLASVGSLFVVALVFRWLMRAAGLVAP
jgi:hypothetical protein